MGEITLENLLARSKGGLSAPLACWIAIRVADAMSSGRAPMPSEVVIQSDGAVRLAPLSGPLRFAYVAPEIAQAPKRPSPRSSVFALAVLLVEIATGRSPFARDTDLATRIAAAEDVVPPLTGRVADATPGLDAILARALSKTSIERFASPAEFAAMLDHHLQDELLEVGPATLAKAIAPFLEPRDAPRREKAAPAATAEDAAPASARPERSERAAPAPPAHPERSKRAAPAPPAHPEASERAALAESKDASSFEAAELDLRPEPRSQEPPSKGSLDHDIVRLGQDVVHGSAGITDAALTGIDPRPAKRRPMPLDVDERALRRNRPVTTIADTAPASEANWALRIVVLLAVVLALAVVYQYVLRPYLRPQSGFNPRDQGSIIAAL